MKSHDIVARPWMLLLAAALIGSHLIFFRRLGYAGLSVGVAAGLVLLMVAKHLGVLGGLYAWLRRRSRD